jgi:predicted transcriptional regulator
MDNKKVANDELSATKLATELNMSLQSVIQMFVDMGLIKRNGKLWDLTPTGVSKGGKYKESSQTGRES